MHELSICQALIEQGGDQIGVGFHEPVGVGHDLGFQLALDMGSSEGVVDGPVQLGVAVHAG